MSWADLDKLAVARPRADGATMLVVRDERSADRIAGARHLSTLVAISRVVRGRRVLAERHGGSGLVVYATTGPPPGFLVEAVTAAGGIVFDGTREHTAHAPAATTMQLDAAFCDLASAVRRRLDARSFGAALEAREHGLRRNLPAPTDHVAWWSAIFELAALAGELVRETRAGRWIEAPTQRLPLALELGKGELLFPGHLAQALVEGAGGSLRSLLGLVEAPRSGARGAKVRAPALPLLCDRRAVPLEKLTWERLVSEEVDTEDLPVIAYVEDRGGTISWPVEQGPPTAELRSRALANLAREPVELTEVPLPGGTRAVLVTGGFYAAESLLVPATMARVAAELGGAPTLLVGVPARGHLIAIDAARATLDDDLQHAFLMLIERHYLDAPERDRISSEVIVYLERPIGRVQSNLMDARRLLRSQGIDPDAE